MKQPWETKGKEMIGKPRVGEAYRLGRSYLGWDRTHPSQGKSPYKEPVGSEQIGGRAGLSRVWDMTEIIKKTESLGRGEGHSVEYTEAKVKNLDLI